MCRAFFFAVLAPHFPVSMALFSHFNSFPFHFFSHMYKNNQSFALYRSFSISLSTFLISLLWTFTSRSGFLSLYVNRAWWSRVKNQNHDSKIYETKWKKCRTKKNHRSLGGTILVLCLNSICICICMVFIYTRSYVSFVHWIRLCQLVQPCCWTNRQLADV